ncbi:MAG: sigma-70 family RNA polymerase sigma factor [Aestuariibacter sp.]
MAFVISLKNMRYSKATNEWLMLQYRLSQEPKFLEQLYKNCADDLYHFLLTQSEPDMAKEITHLAWVKVMEKRNQFQQGGKFKNWLFTLGRNLLIDEFRRNKKLVELQDEEQTIFCEFSNLDKLQKAQAFNVALEALPFFQREALILMQEGFGLLEISAITEVDTETVKSRIRYAKQKLKTMMSKYHE